MHTSFSDVLRPLVLSGLVAVGLLIVGCDSGGSNGGGNNLSGSITAKVEGGSATGNLSATFKYDEDGGVCTQSAFTQDFSAPGEQSFDPDNIAFGQCESDPSKWDAVEVAFNPDGSADGLTLTVTSGGSDIASTSETNSVGNLEVEAGSVSNDGS
jgi:hypothetical protein